MNLADVKTQLQAQRQAITDQINAQAQPQYDRIDAKLELIDQLIADEAAVASDTAVAGDPTTQYVETPAQA